MPDTGILEKILDIARWAPSGDNTQPWRFELVDAFHLTVHGFDTREHCVYDLDGHPSQISLGALIESIAIAASVHGWRMSALRRPGMPDTHPTFDIAFIPDQQLPADSLAPCIETRSVQRRPMRMRALTIDEKAMLAATLGQQHQVIWLEGNRRRFAAARLMFNYGKLRLTMPEAFEVHRSVIEWNCQFSVDRIPDQALGVDPMTAKLMRWIMQSWRRVKFFNTFLAGTLAPRIQMDLIPGIACAAHFVILAKSPPATVDDYVFAGRVMQRFWLTASQLGLQLQPEMTPLIFARYARNGLSFSTVEHMQALAQRLAQQSNDVIGEKNSLHAVFMGRIGAGNVAPARSMRRPLTELILPRGS
jgi:hypothetical protein